MNKEEEQTDSAPGVMSSESSGSATQSTQKAVAGGVMKIHAIVKIPQQLLIDYEALKGAKVYLTFKPVQDVHMNLVFTGFDKDNNMCIQQELEVVEKNSLRSFNETLGMFSKNDGGSSLHNLLFSKPARDWYLTPVHYNETDNFVSYELSDFPPKEGLAAAAVYKLNPSPPA